MFTGPSKWWTSMYIHQSVEMEYSTNSWTHEDNQRGEIKNDVSLKLGDEKHKRKENNKWAVATELQTITTTTKPPPRMLLRGVYTTVVVTRFSINNEVNAAWAIIWHDMGPVLRCKQWRVPCLPSIHCLGFSIESFQQTTNYTPAALYLKWPALHPRSMPSNTYTCHVHHNQPTSCDLVTA